VRGVVGRAELLGEQAGERLHLVAAGKERELLRVGWRGSFFRRSSMMPNASSQEISSNSLAPRSAPALRFSGLVSRAGEYCFMMPEAPLAQITPWLSGWSGLPSM